jgi:hypothetical protein
MSNNKFDFFKNIIRLTPGMVVVTKQHYTGNHDNGEEYEIPMGSKFLIVKFNEPSLVDVINLSNGSMISFNRFTLSLGVTVM